MMKEDLHTEFKQSFNEETIVSLVAFANAKGGTVYVGVKDSGEPCGVTINSESVQQWINEIKQKTEPAVIPDAEIIQLQGRTVVTLQVQEYPVKPVSYKGRYYRRQANSNHLMSAVEIANLTMQSLGLSWDAYPAVGKTLDDLDTDAISRFIDRVNQGSRFRFSSTDWKENLRKLNLLADGTPTNAAYLLFGKGNVGYNVHAGRFKTATTIIDDKIFRGNLFLAAEWLMDYLLAQIKVAFEITGKTTQRTEIFEYPLTALREIVLNTLIHRDYMSSSDVQVKIFDQSIQFSSPGGLYGTQTIEALASDNYIAQTRNKLIAEAFFLTGDIEKYGTGFTRIRKAIKDYPTMQFSFAEQGNGMMVTLSYTEQRIFSDNVNTPKVDPKDDPKGILSKLTVRQLIILENIRKDNKITREDLTQKMHVSDATVKRELAVLQQMGLLSRVGGRKGGHWEVKP